MNGGINIHSIAGSANTPRFALKTKVNVHNDIFSTMDYVKQGFYDP